MQWAKENAVSRMEGKSKDMKKEGGTVSIRIRIITIIRRERMAMAIVATE